MAMRFGIVGLTVFLSLAGAVVVSAQSAGTGTLVGRVMLCRLLPRALGIADRNPGPVIEAPPGGDDTLPPPIRRPGANVQVSIQGTGLSAITDAGGAFTLAGVPASQPLTVLTQRYTADELVGRQVLAVINFPPRQIATFLSEVLVLGVPDADGNVVLVQPEAEVPLGGRLF